MGGCMDKKIGRQLPTKSVILPYNETEGIEAIDAYNSTDRLAQQWQEQLTYDILATNDEGLYVHTVFGYSVPRRNGKGEILTIIENSGLKNGRQILHTAHRTATSSSASRRLVEILKMQGYEEVLRVKQGTKYEKKYTYAKQMGMEKVTLLDTGGTVSFRTRGSAGGGLGEGFDTLIVDEAQEYTQDQQATLQYTVSDSFNPQIIMCGTPPTAISTGTVFQDLRESCLMGETEDTGWAEWSVDEMSDVNDVELWYECNPAMGYQLNERKVKAENKKDEIDFNIQRLGLWITYNQQSVISRATWDECMVEVAPQLSKELFVGIKYGKSGDNVSMSVAAKTLDGKIFVEAIDCQSVRNGNGWILEFLKSTSPRTVIVDGANGQQNLADEMKKAKLKKPTLPKVAEVIQSNALFEQLLYTNQIIHCEQPSATQVICNCNHRSIGSGGGFGYKALNEKMDISIMESMILAIYAASTAKEKVKKQISY